MSRRLVAMAGVAASREPLGASFARQQVLQAPWNLLVPIDDAQLPGSPGCHLALSWLNCHPKRSLERVQLRVASRRANLKINI